MLQETVLNIFENSWPMIFIFSMIIISMRITYVVKYDKHIVFYKDILALMFIIYILCLFHVVTFQDVTWSTSNFIPFKEMFRYRFASSLFIRNVLGNMLMFIPFGFFVSYFLKLKKPYSILLLSLLISSTIETTQLLIGRVFDVDDILLNVVGGIIGFAIWWVLSKIKSHLPAFLKKDIFYNIIISLILVFMLWQLYQIINLGGAV